MRVRIGELLVKRGVLTPDQVDRVLLEQRVRHRPFGLLAEQLFGVDPRVLSAAWAEQYAADAPKVDPRREALDHDAQRQLTRRQAWQFKLFPLRFESEELVLCTTAEHLPRALNFAYRHIGPACSFVIAEPVALAEALQSHYPWNGPVDMLTGDPTLTDGARERAA